MPSGPYEPRASFLFLVLAAACGPDTGKEPTTAAQDYAATLCAAAEECGCARRFATEADCVSAFQDRFDDALSDADVATNCFDAILDELTQDPCGPLSWHTTENRCDAIVGSKKEGEECSAHYGLRPLFVNECSVGLCRNGFCVSEGLPDVTVGDPCIADDPLSCLPSPDSLYCGPNESCRAKADIGQTCEDPFACGPFGNADAYCAGFGSQGSGVCADQLILGSGCDPFDYRPCSDGWCNPVADQCEAEIELCEQLSYPPVWL
jgi:hypothetical protein